MRKTTLVIDDDLIRDARAALGTSGIKDTIDQALRDAVARQAQVRLMEFFGDPSRHDLNDPDVMKSAWRE